VQKLNPADPVASINFSRWTLQCVHDGIVDQTLLFTSDEAWFHLSGHWNTENPHAVHEVPLQKWVYGVRLVVGE
jgi:hypothetical protein